MLVFWAEENAVTCLPATNIMDPPGEELKTEVSCKVKYQQGLYTGKVAAIGKDLWVIGMLTLFTPATFVVFSLIGRLNFTPTCRMLWNKC